MFQKGFVIADTIIVLAIILYFGAWGKAMFALEQEHPYDISRQARISEAERATKSQIDARNKYDKSNHFFSFESKDGTVKANSSTEKTKTEDAITRYTWWLTVFTAILAIATTLLAWWTRGLWHFARKQAEDTRTSIVFSQKAFLTAQRPWLAVSAELQTGITWDRRGAHISIKFVIKNIGKDPAFDIYFGQEINVHGTSAVRDAVINVSNTVRTKNIPYSTEGSVLLPNEEVVHECTFLCQMAIIDHARKTYGISDFQPFVAACVDYRSDLTGNRHRTAKAIFVLRKRPIGSNAVKPLDFEESASLDDLSLHIDPSSTIAD